MSLNLSDLRVANKRRLPLFKNRKGGIAHPTKDGSDWTPARWLQAMIGEVGEWAQERLDYEDGNIKAGEFRKSGPKELADVQCYLDILAWRSLDITDDTVDSATMLMAVVAALGAFANDRKKLERGDYTAEEYAPIAEKNSAALVDRVRQLVSYSHDIPHRQQVVEPDILGVDLGHATVEKFNEVSERVECDAKLVYQHGLNSQTPSSPTVFGGILTPNPVEPVADWTPPPVTGTPKIEADTTEYRSEFPALMYGGNT